jgi:hypothetical protein
MLLRCTQVVVDLISENNLTELSIEMPSTGVPSMGVTSANLKAKVLVQLR